MTLLEAMCDGDMKRTNFRARIESHIVTVGEAEELYELGKENDES